MDRPYRDDEERQSREVVRHAMNVVSGVRDRHLDFAATALWMAQEELEVLQQMIECADEEVESEKG